jgi:hypothetical protein
MADEPFSSPNHKPSQERQAQPGELLFEFYRERDKTRWRCELREYEYGCEAQFFRNEEFFESPNFTRSAGHPRTLAWAADTRNALESGGAMSESARLRRRCVVSGRSVRAAARPVPFSFWLD